ncbi:hypothetical protein [Enterobacter sp. Bisph1]|uniref:hypothetical protein n=1 Tax=Enterobacter sp. Bisph1 TaxID=1274399 RepID=UPI0012E0972F|nr:hypothetical protein [Enterobacter sp. Bisph1]
MKWDNVAILILDEIDSTIESTVLSCLRRYPNSYLVSKYEPKKTSPLNHAKAASANILEAHLTLFSKLIIIGHGAPHSCARYYPDRLAYYLRCLGVRTVGLISFKSCDIGNSIFLENFAFECVKVNIQLGWCIGYKGTVHPFMGHFVIGEIPFDMFLRFATCGWLKLPDAMRVKVVRGSAAIPNPFYTKLGKRF